MKRLLFAFVASLGLGLACGGDNKCVNGECPIESFEDCLKEFTHDQCCAQGWADQGCPCVLDKDCTCKEICFIDEAGIQECQQVCAAGLSCNEQNMCIDPADPPSGESSVTPTGTGDVTTDPPAETGGCTVLDDCGPNMVCQDGTCTGCPNAHQGCKCNENQSCNSGLECEDSLCMPIGNSTGPDMDGQDSTDTEGSTTDPSTSTGPTPGASP